ncbi:hypothetical protein BD779DRAFT_1477028, partial [Infundibulicybe gibba]
PQEGCQKAGEHYHGYGAVWVTPREMLKTAACTMVNALTLFPCHGQLNLTPKDFTSNGVKAKQGLTDGVKKSSCYRKKCGGCQNSTTRHVLVANSFWLRSGDSTDTVEGSNRTATQERDGKPGGGKGRVGYPSTGGAGWLCMSEEYVSGTVTGSQVGRPPKLDRGGHPKSRVRKLCQCMSLRTNHPVLETSPELDIRLCAYNVMHGSSLVSDCMIMTLHVDHPVLKTLSELGIDPYGNALHVDRPVVPKTPANSVSHLTSTKISPRGLAGCLLTTPRAQSSLVPDCILTMLGVDRRVNITEARCQTVCCADCLAPETSPELGIRRYVNGTARGSSGAGNVARAQYQTCAWIVRRWTGWAQNIQDWKHCLSPESDLKVLLELKIGQYVTRGPLETLPELDIGPYVDRTYLPMGLEKCALASRRTFAWHLLEEEFCKMTIRGAASGGWMEIPFVKFINSRSCGAWTGNYTVVVKDSGVSKMELAHPKWVKMKGADLCTINLLAYPLLTTVSSRQLEGMNSDETHLVGISNQSDHDASLIWAIYGILRVHKGPKLASTQYEDPKSNTQTHGMPQVHLRIDPDSWEQKPVGPDPHNLCTHHHKSLQVKNSQKDSDLGWVRKHSEMSQTRPNKTRGYPQWGLGSISKMTCFPRINPWVPMSDPHSWHALPCISNITYILFCLMQGYKTE